MAFNARVRVVYTNNIIVLIIIVLIHCVYIYYLRGEMIAFREGWCTERLPRDIIAHLHYGKKETTQY